MEAHAWKSFLAQKRGSGAFHRVKVKICCISSQAEAGLAIACGADALGLVSSMPSGPGVIDEGLIARIAAAVPPSVATFLLTSLQTADEIAAQQRKCGTNTVQICDRLERVEYARLRERLPVIALVQVIHVRDGRSVEEVASVAPLVDALLLDSGNQSLPVKELGGTGRVHDWSVSRAICERVSVPVFRRVGCDLRTWRRPSRRCVPRGWIFAAACARTGAWTNESCARLCRWPVRRNDEIGARTFSSASWINSIQQASRGRKRPRSDDGGSSQGRFVVDGTHPL